MPLDVIAAPTDISNSGLVSQYSPITTLSNGGYAVAYTSGNVVFASTFTAQGQLLSSGGVDSQALVEWNAYIAGLSGGGYALAWEDVLADEIFTAVFNAQGQQLSPSFDVTNGPYGDSLLGVDPLSTGGYVVTWESQVTLGNYDIFLATYDADGQQVIAPINVSDMPDIDDQGSLFGIPVVAVLSNGNYALTWNSGTLDTGYHIFTAVYGADGQQVAAPANVTNSIYGDNGSTITALSNGGYALAWASVTMSGGLEGFTAVYTAEGQQVAPPVDVGPLLLGSFPQIAALSNGDYALLWDAGSDVFTAVYNAQGQPFSAPVKVSSTAGYAAQVTPLPNGAYVVTWEGQTADGSYDIFTAVYNAQGQEVAAPLDVSNTPGFDETIPMVTGLANGAFALTWGGPGSLIDDVYTAVYQFVDSNVTPGDVSVIGSADFAIDLSTLFNVGGNVTISNNGYAVIIDLSNLFSVGGNFVLSDNGAVLTISLPSLTQVGGSLSVNGNTAAGSVGLGSLMTVTGSVSIDGNTAAGSIDLDSLATVGGSLSVSGNTSVGSVDLSSLTTVTGSVSIDGNKAATAINVGSLDSVTGSVSIDGNTAAGSIDLASLATVGGSLSVDGNTSVGSVDLGSLTTLTGSVSIDGNTAAGSIDLDSLATVGGSLSVDGNTSVGSVDLGSLTNVTGSVSFGGNTSLITLDLHALIQAGGLIIADNGIITLDLSALVSAGGSFAITDNTHLLTIDMPNLTEVTGDLDVSGNSSLTTMNFGSVTTVSGDLLIADNAALTVADLGSLTTVSGELLITDNAALTATNLGGLTTVSGELLITDNAALIATNLGSLTTVSGDLLIADNTAMIAINLGSLTTVSGDLTITDNTSATVIDLGSLTTVSGDLTINTAPDATVDASTLGPGGGEVVLIGDNLTTTVIVGSLDYLQGTLTITSADGVTVSAHAGLADIAIAGTVADDTLIGSARASTTIDAGAGYDTMTGGSADDIFVFDFSVSQHTEYRDILETVHHHDFIALGDVAGVTIDGTIYSRPALTASITAWKTWDAALTTWADMQADNTGGDDFTLFSNVNAATKGAKNTVGTIQLIDGYFHDYDTTEVVQHQSVTVTDLLGDGFDTITNFSHEGLAVTSGGGGDDSFLFQGLSNDSSALNYWANWLSSSTEDGDTIIHVHDVSNNGTDVSAIMLVGVTTDVTTLVNDGIVKFGVGDGHLLV